MFLVRLCLFVCVNLFLCANCSIPVERLCADPTCTEPISEARSKVQYSSPLRGVLSFRKNEEITITSKSRNEKDYWGAVIKGKHGYVPSEFVLEKKIYRDKNQLIPVTGEAVQSSPLGEGTGSENGTNKSNLPQSTESTVDKNNPEVLKEPINPEKTFQVVEGTTIYGGETDEIKPSSAVGTKQVDPTIAPMGGYVKSENSQERATIPPEIINFNSNYKEQTGNNYTVEKVKEDDENVIVQSKDDDEDDEEEGEEEEEENGGDEEEEDEEEEEEEEVKARENELHGNLKNEINEQKVSGSNSESLADKLELAREEKEKEEGEKGKGKQEEDAKEATTAFPVKNEEGSISQTVATVGENSVTSKASASMVEPKVAGEELHLAESGRQTPLGMDATEVPPEQPNTWTILNGPKVDFPAQPGSGSLRMMPGTPQPIMPGLSERMATSAGSQSVPPKAHNSPYQPQGIPPASQLPPTLPGMPSPPQVPIESQDFPTTPGAHPETTQPTPLDLLATPPQPQMLSLASQAIFSQPQTIPSEPPATSSDPLLSAPQQVSSEPLQVPVTPPQVSTKQPLEDKPQPRLDTSPPEVSLGALEDATDNATRDSSSLAPPLTQEEPEEAFRPTSQPALFESSTIFSQFSVSAESLPENSRKDFDNFEIGPEMIQEKTEAITEAFPTTLQPPRLTETEKQFPGSPVQMHSVPPDEEAPSGTIKEPAETETEATVAPSVFPQSAAEMKDIDTAEAFKRDLEAGNANVPEGPGMLDRITEMFFNWFPSTPPRMEETIAEPNHTANIADNLVHRNETAGNPEGPPQSQLPVWISWIFSAWGADSPLTFSNTSTYLVVTAVTVLLFTLGHNFIEKKIKTGPLIAKINKLEHEFLVSSKECLLLKEEAQSLREKLVLYENSANDELVLSLQGELEQSKKARAELEASIEVLQQELDSATEAGLDLNKMLSEVLTQKGGSESLFKSVESLQAQLDSQQRVIDEMTKKLGLKNEENEMLQSALEAANERSANLEEQLGDMKHNLNLHLKEKEDLTQDLNTQINELKTRISKLGESREKDISRLKKESEELEKKLSESSNALTVKEGEVKALKESMKHLKGKGDVDMKTVFDVSRVKGELAKEAKEKQALLEKVQKEESKRKVLGEQVKSLGEEMQKLKKYHEEAEQKKEEAEKKLEVLSTYFKEKETQLQKELGMQEALWAQKKGDEKAVYNMMKSLQEEVDSYKSQNETLKKEILDQERGLKNQIATLEQKAHENWVAARQAERKLEESKQEMAQLRNRLTLLEKNSSNAEGKGNLRSEELNGVETAASPIMHDTSSPLLFPPLPLDPNNSSLLPPGFIPPPMFMPPPIGGFMPPPPFLPGDRRPPPLGRMSSPPLNNRFSPSSPPDYPYERMSSPPLSPPGINYRSPNEDRDHYRHRTPPFPPPLHPRNWDDASEIPGFIPISSQRDSRRDHKGSNVSSADHSSSDSLDKSSRHSGRV